MAPLDAAAFGRRSLAGMALALLAARPLQALGGGPIRLVVPGPPGGPDNLVARLVAAALAGQLGQPVTTENHPGGSRMAAEAVARAVPDGRMLLWSQAGRQAAQPPIRRRPPQDAPPDLAPIGLVTSTPLVLLGRAGIGAPDLDALIALAQRKDGRLSIGTSGEGSASQLAATLLARHAGIAWTMVPYRGSAPALGDLLGGHLDLLFDTLPAALRPLRQRRLQAFAVTGAEATPLLPEVPTAASLLGRFRVEERVGLAAPAGTPPAILAWLSGALLALAGTPLEALLGGLGVALRPSDPGTMRAHLVAEAGRRREAFGAAAAG